MHDYALLDSGHGQKLERFGQHLVVRPSPQALWAPALDETRWGAAEARYERSSRGGGSWNPSDALPESWECTVGAQRFRIKPTGFGHMGVFAEQAPFWEWITEQACPGHEVLNLFAYTGGSTIAAARGGASVTHCDASKGVVQWASDNAGLNDLVHAPIRWIIDDALKFLRREARRERRYHGVILDPPSFGRGPRGQVFKLEESVGDLLDACVDVLADDFAFVLFSAHTPGIGAVALRNLLHVALGRRFGADVDRGGSAHGEMWIEGDRNTLPLPSGTWSAWARNGRLPSADPWAAARGFDPGARA